MDKLTLHSPGAACDVPSALYSLSFAQKPNWTCAMPSDLEIRTYLNGVAEQYNFNAKTTYKTNVEKAIWMDEIKRWKVYLRDRDTNTGYIHECKILLSCAGLFGTPNWPEIPGRETFKGVQMHSARWDKSVDLKGKRVTVFGNGCKLMRRWC